MGERELGTWLLSVAGILKGFLFNILVALKKKKSTTNKKKNPKPKTCQLLRTRETPAGASATRLG